MSKTAMMRAAMMTTTIQLNPLGEEVTRPISTSSFGEDVLKTSLTDQGPTPEFERTRT